MFYVILGAAVFGPYGAEASLRLGFGLLIVLQIRRPLRALIADSAAFSDAQVAFERLSELGLTLTERRREPDDPQHAPALSRDWRRLDLKGVRFKYGDENSKDGFSLGPMEITLKRGEVVFIAGGNGSGKTTLVKVLAGLYPQPGGPFNSTASAWTSTTCTGIAENSRSCSPTFACSKASPICNSMTWAAN